MIERTLRRMRLVTLRLAPLVGALLGFVLGGVPGVVSSARAQVTVAPDTVRVTLAAGTQAEVPLAVAHAGGDTLALALAPAPSAADPPGEPGDVLFTSEEICCGLGGMTMTPEGRLFVEASVGGRQTFELTAELEVVREFDHPVAEFLSSTAGITHDADAGGPDGSLWWMDVDTDDGETVSALLLEGDLDGEPTGRELALPWPDTAPCGSGGGLPVDAVYDAVATGGAGRFYWLDINDETVWAMGPDGAVAEGYPVPLTDYAGVPQPDNPEGCLVTSGLDAHTLSGAAGEASGEPLLEAVTGYPFVHPRNRQYAVVVLDRQGRNRGAETPLFDLPTPDGFGEVRWVSDVVRSRADPSVLYLTVWTGFAGNVRYWVYAVRAAPLPPAWLHASPILFAVEGEAPSVLTLGLDAAGLAPGVYEAVASVRAGDGIGPVVAEVPVELTVTAGTDGEDEAVPGAPSLAVYPNPAAGAATVALSLAEAADVRVAVVDVLGREVAVLHEGLLVPGPHDLAIATRSLPPGLYIVRVTGDGFTAAQRVTIVR